MLRFASGPNLHRDVYEPLIRRASLAVIRVCVVVLTALRILVLQAGFAYLLSPSGMQAHAQFRDVVVFAAASLKNAIDEANGLFLFENGSGVSVSYGASSALAKQIENGAPADIFISADLAWMDYI